ncbi:MAG: UbiA family prenyltransferase [Candidatus Heimdallarchaeaceae archaeon]|jgi:1,4-dihydroxy-2-naphthoate octaprenyltransferase
MLEQVEILLKDNNRFRISSCSYSSSDLTNCSYVSDGLDLYFANVENTSVIQQISYNPKVVVSVSSDSEELTYYGYAEIIKEHPEKEKLLKKLTMSDKLKPEGIFRIALVRIKPLEIVVPQLKIKERFPDNEPSVVKEVFRSLLGTLKIWMNAVRLPFVSVSVGAVLVGAAVAFFELGIFNWLNFFLTFFGIAIFHICADLFNDFFDHVLGSDEINLKLTPFSGGSRFIQNRIFTPTRVLLGAIISLLACAAIGFYLNFSIRGNVIVYIGLAGAFLGVFYVGVPFKILHYGLGELAIFLSFGPAIVFGSYYVQAEQFSGIPIAASALIGLLIALILFINQFPDYEADKASGKKHWVVRLGREKSTYVYISFMSLVYILLILFVALRILPLLSLIALISLFFAIKAMITTKKNYDNYLAMIPAQAMTILTCLSFSILLAISLFISYLF